jgi:hypothetical protein
LFKMKRQGSVPKSSRAFQEPSQAKESCDLAMEHARGPETPH